MGASDAERFVDKRDAGRWRSFRHRFHLLPKQIGKSLHGVVSAGRAQVDGHIARHNRLSIGATPCIPALCALRLRQEIVDLIDDPAGIAWQFPGSHAQQQSRCKGNARDDKDCRND
jgi:hypothetical protein